MRKKYSKPRSSMYKIYPLAEKMNFICLQILQIVKNQRKQIYS